MTSSVHTELEATDARKEARYAHMDVRTVHASYANA